MTPDLSTLCAGTKQAKLASLEQYVKAALAAVPPGADVTLTGPAPVWLYLKIAPRCMARGALRILNPVV